MTFDVTADAYGRFMGRFSEPLADEFAGLLPLAGARRVLDVGCGPGALTARLVDAVGVGGVSAVDPSPTFTEAVAARFPGLDVRRSRAEDLPFEPASFDLTAAQLVVHFMTDPVRGLAEMSRVTRAGGVVAACVWDHAGGGGPLAMFWEAVRELDPSAPGEAELPGTREGHLEKLAEAAGLHDVAAAHLEVRVPFASFEEWWDPFLLGVGPAGSYVAGLTPERRAELRAVCARRAPTAPFTLRAVAWAVTGRPRAG